MQQKTPSPPHKVLQDDAYDLVEICVKDIEHFEAGILREKTARHPG